MSDSTDPSGDIDIEGFLIPLRISILVNKKGKQSSFVVMEGVVVMEGGPGDKEATPIFTDPHFAEQWRAEQGAQFADYKVKTLKKDRQAFLDLLTIFEARGLTHVAIDPKAGRSFFIAIGDLRKRLQD